MKKALNMFQLCLLDAGAVSFITIMYYFILNYVRCSFLSSHSSAAAAPALISRGNEIENICLSYILTSAVFYNLSHIFDKYRYLYLFL